MTVDEVAEYAKDAWPVVQQSAGGYYFEKTPHLFSEVRGNWFDIMGLSIAPIAKFLNQYNIGARFEAPKIAAVLGHPIAQSKSPRIHGHWLKTNKISGDYIAIDIPPSRFLQTIKLLAGTGLSGFNVTLPYKESALALADDKTERAKKIGAANTLIVGKDGHIKSDNTDGYGFIANLKKSSKNWTPQAGPALVLGAGGAARAILVSLLEAGVPKIYLSNRTQQRALDLAQELSPLIEVIDWGHREHNLAEVFTLVNTTSLGMTGNPSLSIDLSAINSSALVADLIYAPLETALLVQARGFGCEVVGGIGMLLHQGVPGFEAWFGIRPIVDAEIEALVLK
jgi:shikimate dehydrogenase